MAIEQIKQSWIPQYRFGGIVEWEVRIGVNDKRRRDSDNMLTSIQDMLVKAGWLVDDNWQNLPFPQGGVRYSESPYTYIRLKGVIDGST